MNNQKAEAVVPQIVMIPCPVYREIPSRKDAAFDLNVI